MKWKKFILIGMLIAAMTLFVVPSVLNAGGPGPCVDEDLSLTAVCSDDPEIERCWEITNPNDSEAFYQTKVKRDSMGAWSSGDTIPANSTVKLCIDYSDCGGVVQTMMIRWRKCGDPDTWASSSQVPTTDEVCASGGLCIMKYSGDQRLEGAVYDVSDGMGFAAKVTTGADGYGCLDGLADGIYYVKEATPPEGYEIDPEQYTVEVINGKGEIHLENDPIPPPPTGGGEEVEVQALTEEGAVEVLAFTGPNTLFYILGFGLMLVAGGLVFFLRTSSRKR